jgi:hypothetical protein
MHVLTIATNTVPSILSLHQVYSSIKLHFHYISGSQVLIKQYLANIICTLNIVEVQLNVVLKHKQTINKYTLNNLYCLCRNRLIFCVFPISEMLTSWYGIPNGIYNTMSILRLSSDK